MSFAYRTKSTKVLPFLEGEDRRKAFREPGYVVRLFEPKGRYPKARICEADALYWGADDLVFMVTWSQRWDTGNTGLPYTEMDWATAQELRLLASILLCESDDGPPMCFYPVHQFSMQIDARNLNLASPRVARLIKASILERALRPNMMAGEGVIQQCLDADYDLRRKSDFNLERQPEFFSLISVDDHLLLRGIAALIKAEMLTTHREFWEEAIVIAFIALEASFQMVLRELRRKGIVEPTSAQAAKWLHKTFNEPFGLREVERYFEDIYDQRIMTLHPVSRFGICPYAPLFHDDYTLLRRSLPGIFAYLVSGRHSVEYLEAVKRRGN